MKISVYGTGYVGLVSGVCLAEMGHDVLCLDIDENKVARLRRGSVDIHEPGLAELLSVQLAHKRIGFTTEYRQAVTHGDIHVIAVGTPSLEDGRADMSYVHSVAKSIATFCDKDLLVVNKSTVPVGSGERVEEIIRQCLQELNKNHQVRVVSNPEFLREGRAVQDFLQADRIIVGCGDAESEQKMRQMYHALIEQGIPFLALNRTSAELSKYAANGLLATKISFINEISRIASEVGADVEQISHAIGLDHRIGLHYNQAGCGYGGSCFPKDVKALKHTAELNQIKPHLIEAVDRVNQEQRYWLVTRVNELFGQALAGKTFGVWGLAFKPGTNDIREAPSLVLLDKLLEQGAQIYAYDPVAMPETQTHYLGSNNISFVAQAEEVLERVDCLIIVTEWEEFKQFDLSELSRKFQDKPIIDGRNIYDLKQVAEHRLRYVSVGRPPVDRGV